MANEGPEKSGQKREDQQIDIENVHFRLVLMGRVHGGIVILDPQVYLNYRAEKSLKNAISSLRWKLRWEKNE